MSQRRSQEGYHSRVKRLGVPDRFIEHGTQDQLYDECGFGKQGIKDSVLEMIAQPVIF